MALFALLVALVVIPPFYAITCLIDGHVLLGIGVAVTWLMLFRFSRGLLRKFSDGFEYAGI